MKIKMKIKLIQLNLLIKKLSLKRLNLKVGIKVIKIFLIMFKKRK